MMDKGPFVSVANEIVCESPSVLSNVDSLENMEYLGRSVSHRIYWNKTSPSFGLLCGSSVSLLCARVRPFSNDPRIAWPWKSTIHDTLQVDKLNSVARLFAESHLETEPGARLLV
jgi:hypothetical protein